MSRHEKSINRLCTNPPPADFRWSELVSVLERLGYELVPNGGSRMKFIHRGKNALIICHKPHPDPNVDKGCIKGVVEHLRTYGLIK